MAKQDIAFELFYDGAWHDLVTDDDVLDRAPVVIRRGQGSASPAPRPAQINATLANDDDRYRTSNPESPLYGKAGRDTPTRVKVGGVTRGLVDAKSWACDQTPDFRRYPRRGSAWTDFLGGGVLQRINGWTQPLHSALYRATKLSGVTPAEWWPMEDVAGSAAATSAAGGRPMTPVTVVQYTLPDGSPIAPGGAPQFGQGAGVAGSDLLPSFQQGGTLRGPIRSTTFDGYAIDWVMQFQTGTDEGGTTSADVLSWRESGTYVRFTVNVTATSVTVFHANGADDAILSFTGSAVASLNPYDGAAHHYRYQVRQDGGSYSATLYVDGGATVVAVADNFTPGMTGTVGRPTQLDWNPGEDRGDYMPTAAGHLIVWPSGQLGDQPAVFDALNGRAGELAAIRFSRLLTEEGILHYVSNGYADSARMGPQRVDTLANQLTEIATTDDALIYDYRIEARVYFLARADRYNRTPALELVPEDLPGLPREVVDDLPVHNLVTASQREGGEYTVEDATGPLGTQASPDGVGQEQQTVDVNVFDETDDLPQVANWWLRRGTVDLPRFPQVTVNLAVLSPSKLAEVEAVDVGDVLTIVGFRENVIRLHVLGYTETIGQTSRRIVFNCAPDQQFAVGAYDSTATRYDLATCTMSTAAAPTATTLALAITDDEAWSQTSAYDLLISGELVGIPVGGMGARAGTAGAYTQAATGVSRSKNGIRKTLPAGASVRVATPGRYGL
jgi:hypothetical protein